MPANLTQQLSREQQIAALEKDWATNPRLAKVCSMGMLPRRRTTSAAE